jgi:hypothetical protein
VEGRAVVASFLLDQGGIARVSEAAGQPTGQPDYAVGSAEAVRSVAQFVMVAQLRAVGRQIA